jgi:LSD1 subclass zinc finger protein
MAEPRALTCQKCQAPLPTPTGPTVQCSYCKTVNTVQLPLGTAQLRAVLREELGHARPTTPPAQAAPMVPVLLGLAVMVSIGGVVGAATLLRERPSPPPGLTARPPLPPQTPIPPELPAEPEAPPAVFGVAQALKLLPDALVLLTDTQLVVIDRASRQQRWATPLRSESGRLAVAGETVMAANSSGAFFYSLRSGEKHASFLWKSGGFKVVTCATKSGQFVVKTVFDGVYRFDGSGQKTSGTDACTLNDNIDTDEPQKVGWGGPQLANLECRYFFVRNTSKVSFCEEDGTKARFIVDYEGSRIRWRGLRGEGAAGNPEYVAEHQGLILVGERHAIEAFNGESGEKAWRVSVTGNDVRAVSDGKHVIVGSDGVLVELDVATGHEVGRYTPP